MVPSADPGAADPVGGSAGNSRAELGGRPAGLRAEPAVAPQTGYTGDAAPPADPGAAAPLVVAGGSDVDPEAAVVPWDGSGTASAAGRSSSADGDDRWARSESRAADSGERQRWQGQAGKLPEDSVPVRGGLADLASDPLASQSAGTAAAVAAKLAAAVAVVKGLC